MNDTLLRKGTLATAVCGIVASSAFIGYWAHCMGEYPLSLHFHRIFMGPYALIASAALLCKSLRSATIAFVASLMILGLGVLTYQSLISSGIPSINDITNVTLPIQSCLAWMALAVSIGSFIASHRRL